MKTAGIIFLVLAGIAFIAMIGTFASGADVEPGRMFNTVIVNGVIGGVLLHLGNKRKREDDEREKWTNQ